MIETELTVKVRIFARSKNALDDDPAFDWEKRDRNQGTLVARTDIGKRSIMLLSVERFRELEVLQLAAEGLEARAEKEAE